MHEGQGLHPQGFAVFALEEEGFSGWQRVITSHPSGPTGQGPWPRGLAGVSGC